MKKLRLIALFILAATVFNLVGCSAAAIDLTEGFDAEEVTEKAPDEAFISAQTDFSLKLFRNISADHNGNKMISPMSVALALAMTANGADSATKEEMENVLGGGISIEELNGYYLYLKNSASKTDNLKIANSIWLKDDAELFTVRQDFLQKNVNYYGAKAYKAPFDNSTLRNINGWVKKNTNGMIKEILGEIDDDAIMYLINAMAFDARWNDPYEKAQITDGEFHNIDGSVSRVEMMNSTEGTYVEGENETGFIKPYLGGRYSFAAILPNENISLPDYIASLDGERLVTLLNNTKSTSVIAAMPKFSFDYEKELRDTLCEMGMESAFDVNTADFSNMGEVKYQNVFINRVLHKTHITVDELGTKAGAATVVEMNCGSAMPIETYTVTLDRPFVFMIIDNETKLPVFIGAVANL